MYNINEIIINCSVRIHGHNEYVDKAYSTFNVAKFARELFGDEADSADSREDNPADGHDLSE